MNIFVLLASLMIIDRPLSFGPERQALTRQYIREHYGIETDDIRINPQMIVLHWTGAKNKEGTFSWFNQEAVLNKGVKELGYSAHFLIDRDGTCYKLMPTDVMARHVIGLNLCAIGIENVGGVDGQEDLTDAQVKTNTSLIKELSIKHPTITYLIGHHEYLAFSKMALWKEKDKTYRSVKKDPGPLFMKRVRLALKQSGLIFQSTPQSL